MKSLKAKIQPVILAGGVGQRLWPMSRMSSPKQYLEIFEGMSLYSQTLQRVKSDLFVSPIIVTTESQKHQSKQQLLESKLGGDLIIEPSGKNTAASILAATYCVAKTRPDALLCIMPSDHYLPNITSFEESLITGIKAAEEKNIITLGQKATRPETGYGYIELSENAQNIADAISFKEKPNREIALQWVRSGNFYWNMGIFLFQAETIMKLATENCFDLLKKVKLSVDYSEKQFGDTHLNSKHWEKIEEISFDHAIMEKTTNIKTIIFSGSWSDYGDWAALRTHFKQDKNNNVNFGNSHQLDCENSTLWSHDGSQVLVGLGLRDIMAVATKDAILVADANQSQKVREVVKYLENKNIKQGEQSHLVVRPWGNYQNLHEAANYKIRLLHLNPKCGIKRQTHQFRMEHWFVVDGTGTVILNGLEQKISKNQSQIIHQGDKHELKNDTNLPLTVIETQTGKILSEDDIFRG